MASAGAAGSTLDHLHFPTEHRRRLHSTNPLERLHKEIKRRTNVVGNFPNRASLDRMAVTLLQEQELRVAGRRPSVLHRLDGPGRFARRR